MKILCVSNNKIIISILTLALILSFSGHAFSSTSLDDVELKLSGDQKLKLDAPATADASGTENKYADYNEKLAEIIKKYNEKHRAEYLAGVEKKQAADQKGPPKKGAFGKTGPRPDMKEMNRMGRPDHDAKGLGPDRSMNNTKSGVTRYTPPGEKIDPLFSLEQPNQTSDVFSYAGSLIFGMVMRYPVEYAKRYAQNYADKNYKKQVEQMSRTRRTVSDAYHKPVRTIENSISKNFFSGGTDEVNLNFFYMRSTMGVRMSY